MLRPVALSVSLSLTLLLAACAPATRPAQPGPEFTRLEQAFRALPAAQQVTQLRLQPLADGGTLVGGRLAGATFALRFPAQWNRQSLVFAHGYTLLGSGPDANVDTVPADPVAQDTTAGIFTEAYARGFAVGQSTYDKRGFAVESGIERTVALSRLLDALGAERAYIAGGSQGGSITELAIERYPEQFAGALAACGVVGGWEPELNYVTHLRALYNYFAAGTRYELPGVHDVTRTAGPSVNTIGGVLLKLYAAARLQPQGEAARIIRQTVSAVPGVRAQDDFATLLMPLAAQMTGAEDFWAQAGGVFVDNTRTLPQPPALGGRKCRAEPGDSAVRGQSGGPGAGPRTLDAHRNLQNQTADHPQRIRPAGARRTRNLAAREGQRRRERRQPVPDARAAHLPPLSHQTGRVQCRRPLRVQPRADGAGLEHPGAVGRKRREAHRTAVAGLPLPGRKSP